MLNVTAALLHSVYFWWFWWNLECCKKSSFSQTSTLWHTYWISRVRQTLQRVKMNWINLWPPPLWANAVSLWNSSSGRPLWYDHTELQVTFPNNHSTVVPWNMLSVCRGVMKTENHCYYRCVNAFSEAQICIKVGGQFVGADRSL